MVKEKREFVKNFVDEQILTEEIKKVFNDPKYKNNFKLYPYFEQIAIYVALDFNIKNMPEILKEIKIKPFGMAAQIDGVYQTKNGTYTTGALGLSCKEINPKYNKIYKMRHIFINQYFADRERFDFDDFTAHMAEKYGKNFDRIRREEVSSQNDFIAKMLFDDLEVFVDEQEKKKIHSMFSPRVRLKKGYGELFQSLEKGVFDKKLKSYNEKLIQKEVKATLLHEFIHSLSDARGLTLGGVSISNMMLHEGMTEYLTVKTIEKHKKYFEIKESQKVKPFVEYKPFYIYAKMMELIFPGSVEDVYFNGTKAIQKYKIEDFSLTKMMEAFAPIELFYDIEKDEDYIVKQTGARHILKSFLKQKHAVKELCENQKISKKRCNDFIEDLQMCYDSILSNKQFKMDFDFINKDLPPSKNSQRKQRQEYYRSIKK